MLHRNRGRSIWAVAVVLALSAPGAHAESRDTGVGRDIAAQGNHALHVIRAEVAAAIQRLAPSLADVRVRKDPAPAPTLVRGGGATFVATTAVRAAE